MHVLLLGGHGRVALHLTPLLLARGWKVTSVIRNAEHENEIRALGKAQKGKLDVLVSSLDDVKSVEDARELVEGVGPDYVVWAAGAGGKGGPARTNAVDCIAAQHILTASFSSPQISKFLLISHLGSRRIQPSWMTEDDWGLLQHMNNDVLPAYARAKLEVDEYMTALAERRKAESRSGGGGSFQAINLRPGLLSDSPATRKVQLGKSRARGSVTREDVAIVADSLLAREDTGGWYDLLNGDEGVEEAVERVVRDRVDAVEGENVEGMVRRFFP